MIRQRWLVTGGLGFIGSAFVRRVIADRPDIAVTVLDAMTYAGNPANVASVADNPRYRFVRGNIADRAAVEGAIGDGVDAIVNFAAESHVDRSIIDPEAFLRTGVQGVYTLLEAVRERRIARYVQVSTDEVYGDVEHGASCESDPVRPRSPYAAAKAAGDHLVLSYHTTFGLPVLISRGSNTYGPHQYPEKLIPLFVTNLLDGEPVPLYGDGLQVRDWLYVDDHAAGVLHVLENGAVGEVYNIAGGHSRTNIDVTRRLLELTGRSWDDAVRHVADRAGHDRRYCLDAAKISALGFRTQVDFDRGIAETVAWYRSRQDWWRPIKSGEFRAYYERQYGERLRPAAAKTAT